MDTHTMEELRTKQALPLSIKVKMTENRIREWVKEYGLDGVYISFSGGKDSTVLLDIGRKIYPDLLAVFSDTGLEYPEIREFVKSYENVTWVKPKHSFKQIITKYGYPFISKEVSEVVDESKRCLEKLRTRVRERERESADEPLHLNVNVIRWLGEDALLEWEKITGEKAPNRLQMILGKYKKKTGELSAFNCERYKFFLDSPFKISNKCCYHMKKSPIKRFAHETGRLPITAQMATESRLRMQKWLIYGCNGFQMTFPISNPMSFWTEQDVLAYIKLKGLKIAPVYGDIVEVKPGNLDWNNGPFDEDRAVLKTTMCQRTGCMFCGYGAHLEKPEDARFVRLKTTHPKQYDYIMRPTEQGGLNYKEVIDWINEHGNLHILY